MLNKWMTVKNAAKHCGVSQSFITKLARETPGSMRPAQQCETCGADTPLTLDVSVLGGAVRRQREAREETRRQKKRDAQQRGAAQRTIQRSTRICRCGTR